MKPPLAHNHNIIANVNVILQIPAMPCAADPSAHMSSLHAPHASKTITTWAFILSIYLNKHYFEEKEGGALDCFRNASTNPALQISVRRWFRNRSCRGTLILPKVRSFIACVFVQHIYYLCTLGGLFKRTARRFDCGLEWDRWVVCGLGVWGAHRNDRYLRVYSGCMHIV